MKFVALLLSGALVMSAQSPFDSLVDRYFDDYFRLNPTAATSAGFHHPYDSQLEDYSSAGTQAQIALETYGSRRLTPMSIRAVSQPPFLP